MSKIIVIGGSVGAVAVLKLILAALPRDFSAAILIVTHVGSAKSVLPDMLSRCSALSVRHATDGERIVPGCVLVAPPDTHLIVTRSDDQVSVRLINGAKENHCRPAIDPLFRSAAITFGPTVVGVLLSGYLDDGTVGLQAVKACGGLTLVQNPVGAEAPEMPASAIKYAEVDQVLDVPELVLALIELAGADTPPNSSTHAMAQQNWLEIENRASNGYSDMEDLDQIGTPSSLTCPECSGSLWVINHNGPLRYRCHTGHAFTGKVLASLKSTAVEEAMWSAIRALHEQERLFEKLGEKDQLAGLHPSAAEYEARAVQAKLHSQALRDVMAAHAFLARPKIF